MMKRLVVIGNWKMSPEMSASATKLFLEVAGLARRVRDVQVVVCPPFVWLSECRQRYRGKALALGAQDVSVFGAGSHTGEVSASMLRALGVTHSILGHSERRAQGESDEVVAQKVKQIVESGMTAILCIGEKSRDSNGEYLHFLRAQLERGLHDLLPTKLAQLIIAYEPVWAIGKTSADAMRPDDMHETSLYIRKVLSEKYTFDQARLVPILYGGSVEPENAEGLLARGEIDGFLVGRASLDTVSFGAILRAAHAQAKRRS